jgi:hypothetical protein
MLSLIAETARLTRLHLSHRESIVVPAGIRSIARMRACLVSGRAATFDDEGADRIRDLRLLNFWVADRVVTLVFDLDLVMGSSEVRATPSASITCAHLPSKPVPDLFPL